MLIHGPDIRNAETERLAAQVTALTGETKTRAVTAPCAIAWMHLRNHRSGRRLAEVARRCASLPVIDDRSPEEILGYDEDGVPR